MTPPDTAARVSVVLVEDNRMFRETLSLLLGLRDGLDVVATVESGAEAAAECARSRPDVVLMDYRMPGLNGAQATREVLAASPGSQVVCLTASVSRVEVDELLAAGVYACLTKDVELDRIVATIREAAAAGAPA
jgi:DNA-binding NarL/FixJ family response regulator